MLTIDTHDPALEHGGQAPGGMEVLSRATPRAFIRWHARGSWTGS